MTFLLLIVLLSNLFASKIDNCASFKIGKRHQIQGEIIAQFDLKDGIRTVYHCQERL